MRPTCHSTASGVLESELEIRRANPADRIIALAGNPNVGKSTVFNSLTGLNQHTGNWPGKTVVSAQGRYRHRDADFIMVDIPGTYSLMANSAEEEAARDFVCFGKPDATVVVTDATCLERNLNLVLQILEITPAVVVCVNLMDEAKRKKIRIDLKELSTLLGVPVVGASARSGRGLGELMDAVHSIADKNTIPSPLPITYDEAVEKAVAILEPAVKELLGGGPGSRWLALKLLDGDESLAAALQKYLDLDLSPDAAGSGGTVPEKLKEAAAALREADIGNSVLKDKIVSRIVRTAEEICRKVVSFENGEYNRTDRKIDAVLTSKVFGIPIMIGLLGVVFWLTITGANVPSEMLARLLFYIEDRLTDFFLWLGTPAWVHGLLILGVYRTLAWVVSVMLPPMAIFFPLFTLLEDLGYLPRVAFNLDNFFKKACSHGKQALTMCMGNLCCQINTHPKTPPAKARTILKSLINELILLPLCQACPKT